MYFLLTLIIFKYPELEKELNHAPTLLKKVAGDFAFISNAIGVRPTVTRVSAHVRGSSGVHEDLRGVDFRHEYLDEFLYTKEEADLICDYVNVTNPRNDGYKTCAVHSFKDGPKHFHVQIPDRVKNSMHLASAT